MVALSVSTIEKPKEPAAKPQSGSVFPSCPRRPRFEISGSKLLFFPICSVFVAFTYGISFLFAYQIGFFDVCTANQTFPFIDEVPYPQYTYMAAMYGLCGLLSMQLWDLRVWNNIPHVNVNVGIHRIIRTTIVIALVGSALGSGLYHPISITVLLEQILSFIFLVVEVSYHALLTSYLNEYNIFRQEKERLKEYI